MLTIGLVAGVIQATSVDAPQSASATNDFAATPYPHDVGDVVTLRWDKLASQGTPGETFDAVVVAPGIAVTDWVVRTPNRSYGFGLGRPLQPPSTARSMPLIPQIRALLTIIGSTPTGQTLLANLGSMQLPPAAGDTTWGTTDTAWTDTNTNALSGIHVLIGPSDDGWGAAALNGPASQNGQGSSTIISVPANTALRVATSPTTSLVLPPDVALFHELVHAEQALRGAMPGQGRYAVTGRGGDGAQYSVMTSADEALAWGAPYARAAVLGYATPGAAAGQIGTNRWHQASILYLEDRIRQEQVAGNTGNAAALLPTLNGRSQPDVLSEWNYVNDRGLTNRPFYGRAAGWPASEEWEVDANTPAGYESVVRALTTTDLANPVNSTRLVNPNAPAPTPACTGPIAFFGSFWTPDNCTTSTIDVTGLGDQMYTEVGSASLQDSTQCLLPRGPVQVAYPGLDADWQDAISDGMAAWNAWELPVTFSTNGAYAGQSKPDLEIAVDSSATKIKYDRNSCGQTITITLPGSPSFQLDKKHEIELALGYVLTGFSATTLIPQTLECHTVFANNYDWRPGGDNSSLPCLAEPSAWDAAEVWAAYGTPSARAVKDNSMIQVSSSKMMLGVVLDNGTYRPKWFNQSEADSSAAAFRWSFIHAPGFADDNWGEMVNLDTGQCLDIPRALGTTPLTAFMTFCSTSTLLNADSSAGNGTFTLTDKNPTTPACMDSTSTTDDNFASSHACQGTSDEILQQATPSTTDPVLPLSQLHHSQPDALSMITSNASSQCLTASNSTAGSEVTIKDCVLGTAQQWTFHRESGRISVYDPAWGSSSRAPGAVPEAPALCLDATTATSGAPTVQKCYPTSTKQTWTLKSDGEIQNTTTQECLDASDATARVTGYPPIRFDSCGQSGSEDFNFSKGVSADLFYLSPDSSSSGRKLTAHPDLPYGSGTEILTLETTPTDIRTAQWRFIPDTARTDGAGELLGGTASHWGCLSEFDNLSGSGMYEFFQGNCVAPTNSTTMWRPSTNSAELTRFEATGTGISRCLDNFSSQDYDGAEVGTWSPCHDGDNQHWRATPVSDPISTANTGQDADVSLPDLTPTAQNIAPQATVTVSNSNSSNQSGAAAVDGVIGDPAQGEWVTKTNTSSNWIDLAWSSPHKIDRVFLYDRASTDQWTKSVKIAFSDGSGMNVSGLPNTGDVLPVTFPAKTVTSIRVYLTGGTGANLGLSEVQVFTVPDGGRDVGGNTASATLTATSVASTSLAAAGAADGVIGQSGSGEWGSGATNPSLRVEWPHEQLIDTIVLYDRPDILNQVTSATIIFPDGTVLNTDALPNDGSAYIVTFAPRYAKFIQVSLTGFGSVGLSEIQAAYARSSYQSVPVGEDIARVGVATQSSTANVAGKPGPDSAIDGNTDAQFGDGSVTHTNYDAGAWWKLDMLTPAQVTNIVVHGRTDCCQDRLSDVYVFASNNDIDPTQSISTLTSTAGISYFHITGQAPPTFSGAINNSARYVVIKLGGTNYLSLAEVQVMKKSETILKGVATQSSTYMGAVANRALDGNTDGVFNDGSVTHTNVDSANPYLMVDLGAQYNISKITVWGRTDCCQDRLSNVTIYASPTYINPNGGLISSLINVLTTPNDTVSGQMTVPYNSSIKNVKARYIIIQKNGTGTLSLAEVQVRAWQF